MRATLPPAGNVRCHRSLPIFCHRTIFTELPRDHVVHSLLSHVFPDPNTLQDIPQSQDVKRGVAVENSRFSSTIGKGGRAETIGREDGWPPFSQGDGVKRCLAGGVDPSVRGARSGGVHCPRGTDGREKLPAEKGRKLLIRGRWRRELSECGSCATSRCRAVHRPQPAPACRAPPGQKCGFHLPLRSPAGASPHAGRPTRVRHRLSSRRPRNYPATG